MSLSGCPNEVLICVVKLLDAGSPGRLDICNLARCSKKIHSVVAPILYHHSPPQNLPEFIMTLLRNPALRVNVRTFKIGQAKAARKMIKLTSRDWEFVFDTIKSVQSIGLKRIRAGLIDFRKGKGEGLLGFAILLLPRLTKLRVYGSFGLRSFVSAIIAIATDQDRADRPLQRLQTFVQERPNIGMDSNSTITNPCYQIYALKTITEVKIANPEERGAVIVGMLPASIEILKLHDYPQEALPQLL